MFENVVLRRYLELTESGSGAAVRYTHERGEK